MTSCNQCYVGGGKRAARGAAPSQSHFQGPTPAPISSKRPYDHYYAALDQMAKSQPREASKEGQSPGHRSPLR